MEGRKRRVKKGINSSQKEKEIKKNLLRKQEADDGKLCTKKGKKSLQAD